MPYQLKLDVLEKPKQVLSEVERRAAEQAINDCALFLENSLRASIQRHNKTGKTASAIRKMVFRIKLSAKVYFDLNVAPHAAELMRGNKRERTMYARNSAFGRGAMKFTIQGRQVFARKVVRPRTFGLRTLERMRNNGAVIDRLRHIFATHFAMALSGESTSVNVSPVVIS